MTAGSTFLCVDPLLHYLHDVQAFVRRSCQSHLNEPSLLRIELIVEEVFVNIVQHSGLKNNDSILITCTLDKQVKIVFTDPGKPFNPLNYQTAEEGGLGINLVKSLVDELIYDRENETNVLTLIKTI
jgi:serine/threonine-protein kinase RsbW